MPANSFFWRGCVVLLAAAALLPAQSEPTANERIQQIRRLSKKDSQAIPVLAQFVTDPSRDIRMEAVKAIVKIGTHESLQPLIVATSDRDPAIAVLATDGIVNFFVPGYIKGGLSAPLDRGVGRVKAFFSVPNRSVISPGVTVSSEVNQAITNEITKGANIDAQANAARAAGVLRDEQALPALEAAVRSKNTELILEALIALQKIHDPAAGPAVGFLTRDLETRVQLTALETVGDLRSVESAADVRSALQNAKNDKVRAAALQALALLGVASDRATFQQYATDSNPSIRAAALEGLGRIREPEDYRTLETAFNEQGADWRVHLAAAFGLVDEGKLDTGEFSPLSYLVENLDQSGREDTASAYLTELCRREDVRKALYAYLPQMDTAQKAELCGILGVSGAPDALPVLTNLQRDPDAQVSLAAAKAIDLIHAAPKEAAPKIP